MHRSSNLFAGRPSGVVLAALLSLVVCLLSAAAHAEASQAAVGRGASRVEAPARSTSRSNDDLTASTAEAAQQRKIALLIETQSGGTPFLDPAPTRTTVPPVVSQRPAFLRDVSLPEPDGWTAVAATLALALFFFLRRVM